MRDRTIDSLLCLTKDCKRHGLSVLSDCSALWRLVHCGDLLLHLSVRLAGLLQRRPLNRS